MRAMRKKKLACALLFLLIGVIVGFSSANLVYANFLVDPIPDIHVYFDSPQNETYKNNDLTLEFTVDIPPWYLGNVYQRTEYPYERIKYGIDGHINYLATTKIATLPQHKSSFSVPLTGLSEGSHSVEVTAYAIYGGDPDSQRSSTSGKIVFTIDKDYVSNPTPTPYLTSTPNPSPSSTQEPTTEPTLTPTPTSNHNQGVDWTPVVPAAAVVVAVAVVALVFLKRKKNLRKKPVIPACVLLYAV